MTDVDLDPDADVRAPGPEIDAPAALQRDVVDAAHAAVMQADDEMNRPSPTVSPITRTTLRVRHGDHKDIVVPNAVRNVVRKASNQ